MTPRRLREPSGRCQKRRSICDSMRFCDVESEVGRSPDSMSPTAAVSAEPHPFTCFATSSGHEEWTEL